MVTYLIRRLLGAIVVVWIASVMTFIIIRMIPGDPLMVLYGISQVGISDEHLALLRHEHGLDRSLHVQYVTWLGEVLRGDFGFSILNHTSVGSLIKSRFFPTVELGLAATLIAILISIPAGVVSALKPDSILDAIGTAVSFVGAAIPYFLTAFLLIYIVGVKFRWLPTFGYVSPFDDPIENFKRLILPAITLAVPYVAIIMRQTRSSMIEVIHQPYIVTARSKGLMERVVILRHAMKNAMLPVVTILGLQVGNLIGGAVITETMYAYPGMGRLLVESTFGRDYPVIQAIVLMTAVAVTLASILADVAYAYLDPRIRYA